LPGVCNLYRMNRSVAEVANLFGASPDYGANFGEEVYPGYPGLVIAEDTARAMTWGFPLVLKGKQGQPLKPKPVNNTRTDKLASSFWRPSFTQRRCLIPLSAYAEAEGERGRMTRTWFSLLPDEPLFACAGIWRPTVEWGAAYSMVMTDACDQIGPVHDRMPAILRVNQYETWLSGSPQDAFDLCQPYAGAMVIERTDQPWAARKAGSLI
jgi:putative SOS response-associated peptidase YedK